MWGVAKIFTSGHSKGGFNRTPRTTPLATGMECTRIDGKIIEYSNNYDGLDTALNKSYFKLRLQTVG